MMSGARVPEGGAGSLLERVQGLIERTYARDGLVEPGRFVIGDEGLRRLYDLDPRTQRPMVLVRSAGGVQMALRIVPRISTYVLRAPRN